MKDYLSVDGYAESLIVIERSKFISYATRVENSEEAKQFVDKITKMNSLATHNTYAYIADELGNQLKFSDDGEPQGTAGMPILDVLRNKKLYKTCVVVTRYFGGIKLGAGGLVRAYTKSCVEVLNKIKIVENIASTQIKITVDYDKYSKLLKFLENKKLKVTDTVYENDIKVFVVMPNDPVNGFIEALIDNMQGRVITEKLDECFYKY